MNLQKWRLIYKIVSKYKKQFSLRWKIYSDNKINENVRISKHNLELHSNDGVVIYIYKTHPTDLSLSKKCDWMILERNAPDKGS